MRSGVRLQTMTRSTSAASRPASFSAIVQASDARSASVREPLRAAARGCRCALTIHSSVVSRCFMRSAFVTTSSGSAAPMPKTPAFTQPPAACA